jgi:hypothetical protein
MMGFDCIFLSKKYIFEVKIFHYVINSNDFFPMFKKMYRYKFIGTICLISNNEASQ